MQHCNSMLFCLFLSSTDATMSNAVVSNCFSHHICHLHVHGFRYDRTTNVLSLLIFNGKFCLLLICMQYNMALVLMMFLVVISQLLSI